MANRSISIEEKIEKAQEQVVRTKEKYEAAVAVLEELLAKKKAIQSEELLRLFAGSNKSYEEVTAFLKEGIPEEQLASNARKKPGRKPKTRV